jgi:hypothetical protein
MQLRSHARYDYQPITRRPPFAWPDAKRLALYLALNLEHFAFGEGDGAQLVPAVAQPDVLNYAWRDYGNRVGAWRLLELFEEVRLPCSALLNGSVVAYAPELADAFHARGDELVAHGRTNSERQSALDEPAEATLISETTDALRARYGCAKRDMPTSSTGAMTTSRCGCARAAARSCRCPTRRSSTTFPPSPSGTRAPRNSPT